MVRAIVLAALVGGLCGVPAATGRDAPKAKPDIAALSLEALHGHQVKYDKNLNETPLFELLMDLAKRYDLTFIIMDELFKADGVADIHKAKPNLTLTKAEKISVHRFLTLVLGSLKATYLVRETHIEIVPIKVAQTEAGLFEAIAEAKATEDPAEVIRAKARLNLPLVSVAVENKSLRTVVTDLARAYDLNVSMEPGVRNAMDEAKVTERLLNVPADTALETLAAQAGLTVVRKGNVFRITGGGAQ